MTPIHFGTDGWRAIIGRDFTEDNVMRVAHATATWMKQQGMQKVVIGHDFRFGGRMFAEAAARVCAAQGIRVYLDQGVASTPMVSLGVKHCGADVGIIITASHNPPNYNGYKLKSKLGGPLLPADIAAVEACILDAPPTSIAAVSTYQEMEQIQSVDLERIYLEHVRNSFDLDAIRKAGIRCAYDAMYGAGQRVIQALFPNMYLLHCENNPGFGGTPPEPILRNLGELAQLLQQEDDLDLGIATDGDADRIGLFDHSGKFVDSHHILLLLIRYMVEHKKAKGKVAISFSVSDKVEQLAKHYGLPVTVTPIGFKHIAEVMSKEDVVVGGEESGGLAVKGHIPERDGIWIGLMIMEYMAVTGKTLQELISEVYSITGPFAFDRADLHLTEQQKQQILQSCQENKYSKFGNYTITGVNDLDGYRYLLGPDRWVMLRASGTEPLLRVYAQAPDQQEVNRILDAVKRGILG